MTVAVLGYKIDSSDALDAAANLDKMTSSSAKAEQAAAKVGAAGGRMSRAFADVNPALEKIIGSLSRLEASSSSIDARLDAMSRSAMAAAKTTVSLGNSAKKAGADVDSLGEKLKAAGGGARTFADQSAHVRAFREEIERLRGKYAPLATAANAYAVTVAEIQKAHKLGVISSEQMTVALDKERLAFERLQEAGQKRPPHAPGNDNNAAGRRQNLGYQAFDIGQTAALGMNPAMILAQQGPQVAQLYAGNGGVKALLGDVGALATGAVSAFGALPLAISAAGAAALLYDRNVTSSAVKAEKALKKHEEAIERITGLFDNAGSASERYGQRVQGSINFSARSDRFNLEEALGSQTQAAGRTMQNVVPPKSGAAFTNFYGPYLQEVTKFIAEAAKGKADVSAFNEQIERLANNNQADQKAQKIAQRIQEMLKPALETAAALKSLNDEVARTTMMTARTSAAAAAQSYQSGNIETMLQLRRDREASLSGIGAKSPAQLAAAARVRAAADPVNPNESADVRNYRIESAGALALAQAEQQLRDAQRDRAMNLDKILQDQQSEIDLVGQTGGAAVALRKEYELTAQLRMDAARQGIEVDQQEIGLIKQKAEELGRLTDAYNQSRFNFDMNQEAQDLQMSPRQRLIVQTQRRYGLKEDASDANGQAIDQQLQWKEAKDAATSFGQTFSSTLVSSGGDIGKSFAASLKAALEKQTEKLWDRVFDGLGTMFANWLTGTPGAGAATAGAGLGAVASAFTGKAANDNASYAAPVGAVTRGPLGDISSYAKAIQKIESSGNYGALGPITRSGDRAYGAYQMMGNNIGPWSKAALGKTMSTSEFLADKSAQDAIFNHRFGGYVDKYGAPGAAQAWFGGPGSVGKGGQGADILGTTGSAYVSKFNAALGSDPGSAATATDAVNRLADASKTAAGSVDVLGGGLNKMGSALSSFPAAPAAGASGGGGGFMGWLGSLFGGFTPNGAQATLAASGTITGAFANGTSSAPGGLSMVGERGPELVNLPQGAGVTSNHKLMEVLNGHRERESGGGIAGIRVFMDDDMKLRAVVESISGHKSQQATRQALGSYKQNQQRSGVGTDQKAYNSRKG